MYIKKISIVIALILFITGCSKGNNDINDFTITFDQKTKYKEQIYSLMYDYYWKYDDSTVEFFSSTVPENTDENTKFFEASEDVGLNLKKYAGNTCVVATANLQHFNGDYAGRGYFYFNNDKLSGAYYTSEDTDDVYGFETRNVFLNSPAFKGYESNSDMGNFKEYKSYIDSMGFSDTSHSSDGSFIAMSVNENNIKIYKYVNKRMIIYKSVYVASGGLVPLSATFIENNDIVSGVSVILGENEESEEIEENIYDEEHNHDEEKNISISKKVIFLDDNFSKTGEEMVLENSNCTYIFDDDGQMAIVAGENIEYYSKSENGWEKVAKHRLGHSANHVHITDLDNDGVNEYIMTDGFDLYMYRKTLMGYINIWRTHITVENFTGYIYSGDLNDDGIKEIYISDITGTAVRYVLTEKGLITRNEDIEYGNNIYSGDFNGDGKDDYIKMFFGEKVEQTMYIQQ